MSELKVAACQMRSTDDPEANKKQVREFLQKLEKVDLVSLPENSLFLRIRAGEKFLGFSKDDPFFGELASWAKKNQTCVHLGSVALQNENAKLLNATVWIDHAGQISFPYSKIHLFDVDVEDETQVRESDNFAAGSQPSIVQIKDWKIGLSICYDLRFSELYLSYAKVPVDLILIPSAFLVTTGEAHWHSLIRARAIEAQAYVVAAAQGGEHLSKSGDKRHTYGHSLMVGPWGEILAEGSDQKAIIQTFSKEKISRVRKQIPMQSHRRF